MLELRVRAKIWKKCKDTETNAVLRVYSSQKTFSNKLFEIIFKFIFIIIMETRVYSLKNYKIQNYVIIGNEDAQELLANDMFGRFKEIKVDYVWFKV